MLYIKMVLDIEVCDELIDSVEKIWESVEDSVSNEGIDYDYQEHISNVVESLLLHIWIVNTRRFGEPNGKIERDAARGRIRNDIDKRWRRIHRQVLAEDEGY